MKVIYNSKLAKLFTFIDGFDTMMFMGIVITEMKELSQKTLDHERCHVEQWKEVTVLSALVIMVILDIASLASGFNPWNLLFLIPSPTVYYVIYGGEWIYWLFRGQTGLRAYLKIGFERQARYVARTWIEPDNFENRYRKFNWWGKFD